MHTVFVKLNILNILCFQATRQVKVGRGKHTVHCTIHINSRGGKKKQKKRKEKKNKNKGMYGTRRYNLSWHIKHKHMKVKQEPIGVLRVFTEHRQGNKINADVELFSLLCLLEHFWRQLYLK